MLRRSFSDYQKIESLPIRLFGVVAVRIGLFFKNSYIVFLEFEISGIHGDSGDDAPGGETSAPGFDHRTPLCRVRGCDHRRQDRQQLPVHVDRGIRRGVLDPTPRPAQILEVGKERRTVARRPGDRTPEQQHCVNKKGLHRRKSMNLFVNLGLVDYVFYGFL